MDATRRRFGSVVEWLVAGVCATAGVAMPPTVTAEFRSVRPVVPVSATEAQPAVSLPGIPPGVVSVPLLLLSDDRELRVGERLVDVAGRLGSAIQPVSESVDDVRGRRQISRFYDQDGVRFILVFDSAGRDADARLAAIFLR